MIALLTAVGAGQCGQLGAIPSGRLGSGQQLGGQAERAHGVLVPGRRILECVGQQGDYCSSGDSRCPRLKRGSGGTSMR